MLSIRTFARVLPKYASRPLASLGSPAYTTVRKPSSLSTGWRIASKPNRAAFSTSLRRSEAHEGSVEAELSAKLESELQLERETSPSNELQPHLKEYLDSSPFKLHDTPGEETVVLTRSFGNEKIRVSFSTADLSDAEPDPDAYQEDSALYDEEVGGASQAQSGGAQSKGTVNQGRTQGGNIAVAPEDKVSPADREAAAEDKDAGGAAADEDLAPEPDTSYPVRLHVSVEKKGVEGALYIESIVRDGTNYIENVYHFPRAELADPKTAERDWERRGLYTGPPFGNLDEELQVLLERYLEERGINTALALWVPDYIDFKEQREYMSWLSDAKSFVDA